MSKEKLRHAIELNLPFFITMTGISRDIPAGD